MGNPLTLQQIKNPVLRRAARFLSNIDVLRDYYDEWLEHHKTDVSDARDFLTYALDRLDVTADIVNEEFLHEVPVDGALVVVANHPLGGLEGMLLAQILLAVRPDLKVLTNELLTVFPEFDDLFIGVDVLSMEAQEKNAQGLRSAFSHLKDGGALLVFPAGTVSHMRLPSFDVVDAPWNRLIAKLAQKYAAPILPVFVAARNSKAFYLSGSLHRRLRTLLLPRAMLDKCGTVVPLHFGHVIPAQDLARVEDDQTAMHYVRLCCDLLSREACVEVSEAAAFSVPLKADIEVPVLLEHLSGLAEFRLYEQKDFELYCVPYARMGPIMEQLSIERERTFRQVDEGTGEELDSDQFDPYYMHLFLWDKAKQRLVGGYRLGKTDDIVAQCGLDGLYSYSLFHYDEAFLKGLGKTIEVGRSFITQDYQKNASALDVLWKGIGRFVAQNPDYYALFGCVSISRQYSKLVSALMTETLLVNYGAEGRVGSGVKARVPIQAVDKPWTPLQIQSLSNIPIINKLVGRIDAGKSIPVLIRHYLALKGRFVSFTVNTGFNNALDGLIVVDLRETSFKYLRRYMGEEGVAAFQARWADGVEDSFVA